MVMVWFGLSVSGCSNNEGQQSAGADRTAPETVVPGGFESELFTALSPDARFGVISTVREVTRDQKQILLLTRYVVDSIDMGNMSYWIIDELKYDSDYDWHTFCDSNVLAYTAIRLSRKDEGDFNRICLYRCADGTEAVLLESNAEDSSTHWINELIHYYGINLRDSLIVYQERVGADIQFAGKRLPMRVVVRRILANGGTEVIKKIEDAEQPSISGDGTQIFADRWIEQSPDYYTAAVVMYDLETDTVSELNLQSRFCRSARRLTRDDPIYYLGADTENWLCANIRRYNPQSGIDTALTSHSAPSEIWQYYVTRDSILYLVPQPDINGRAATRWRTLLMNNPE